MEEDIQTKFEKLKELIIKNNIESHDFLLSHEKYFTAIDESTIDCLLSICSDENIQQIVEAPYMSKDEIDAIILIGEMNKNNYHAIYSDEFIEWSFSFYDKIETDGKILFEQFLYMMKFHPDLRKYYI